MEYILSSLEMFAGVSENLINYTFNVRGFILAGTCGCGVRTRCCRYPAFDCAHPGMGGCLTCMAGRIGLPMARAWPRQLSDTYRAGMSAHSSAACFVGQLDPT